MFKMFIPKVCKWVKSPLLHPLLTLLPTTCEKSPLQMSFSASAVHLVSLFFILRVAMVWPRHSTCVSFTCFYWNSLCVRLKISLGQNVSRLKEKCLLKKIQLIKPFYISTTWTVVLNLFKAFKCALKHIRSLIISPLFLFFKVNCQTVRHYRDKFYCNSGWRTLVLFCLLSRSCIMFPWRV